MQDVGYVARDNIVLPSSSSSSCVSCCPDDAYSEKRTAPARMLLVPFSGTLCSYSERFLLIGAVQVVPTWCVLPEWGCGASCGTDTVGTATEISEDKTAETTKHSRHGMSDSLHKHVSLLGVLKRRFFSNVHSIFFCFKSWC